MSLLPTDSAGLQDWIARRQQAGFPIPDTSGGVAPIEAPMQAPAPTQTQAPTGGGDAEALVKQYWAQNPYAGSVDGLIAYLKQQGLPADFVDHRGSPSIDKIWIGGRMYDVAGHSDDPARRHGVFNDVTDAHFGGGGAPQQGFSAPAMPAGGYSANTSGGFGSLAQGYTDQFNSPGNFTAPSMQDAMNSPGFQFRLGEGVKALEQSAASKGTLLTGGTLKDINSWAQDYASNEYDKVYDRALGENNLGYGRAWNEHMLERDNFYTNQDNQFGRYFSLAGLGQNSASNLGAYGSSYANNAGNLITGAGNAQAAGTVGSNNAWGPLWGAGYDIFNQTGWGQ